MNIANIIIVFTVFNLIILNVTSSLVLIETSNTICDEFCDKDGGLCTDSNCTCKSTYTTLPRPRGKFKYCNYEHKRRLVSAFMELLIGFGAGHFYCERTVNGFTKLVIISITCCIAMCLIVAGTKVDLDMNDQTHSTLRSVLTMTCLGFSALLLWQVTDFVLFLSGVYRDGNGVVLL